MLIASTPDDIALAFAVEEKFKQLDKTHVRICGTQLQVEQDLVLDFGRTLALLERYRQNDFRHSEQEKQSVRSIAEWTLWVAHALNEQARVNIDPKSSWQGTSQEAPSIQWRD